MTDNFDLRKYLIENEVTTSSKLLKELEIEIDPEQPTGRRFVEVLEIEIGSHNSLHRVETVKDSNARSFITYCERQAKNIRQKHAEDYIESGMADMYDDLEDDVDDVQGAVDRQSIADTYQQEMGIGQVVFNPTKTACEIIVNDDSILYIIKKGAKSLTPEEFQTLETITRQTPGEVYLPIIDKLMGGAAYTPPDWLI